MALSKNTGRIVEIQGVVPTVVPKCRKVPYYSHWKACEARTLMYRKNKKTKKNRGVMEVYFCTTCNAWHFGHVAKRNRR